MVNYPYPTNFINTLPAWPVDVSCANATSLTTYNFLGYISALQKASNVFYNYTGQKECLNISSPDSTGLDANGWNVLACNEMVMPQGSSGINDMFLPQPWDAPAQCQKKYGLTPQYNWALDYFGGRNPSKDFKHTSNIIFSNGELDPWHVGGVLYNVTPQTNATVSIFIEESAHHLDLRTPNAADPISLTYARANETQIIQ
jgi:lysosomal Pro-X carboxypeptidase